MRVYPSAAGEGLAGLSRCERDCLELLPQEKEPLPAKLIRRDLEARRFGRYSVATIKRALSRLRRLKAVANSRKAPRGYYLAEALPLVRLAARA